MIWFIYDAGDKMSKTDINLLTFQFFSCVCVMLPCLVDDKIAGVKFHVSNFKREIVKTLKKSQNRKMESENVWKDRT